MRGSGDRLELEAVVAASPDRAEPPCPHFMRCGGCALQHLTLPAYRRFKLDQLALVLRRGGIEVEPADGFFAGPQERRRLALHARRGPTGRPVLGLKARRAWSVIDLAACPVSTPEIVAALPKLRALGERFLVTPKSAPTLHVTATTAGLAVDVTGVETRRGGFSGDERADLAAAASDLRLAQLSLSGEIFYEERAPLVVFGGVPVALPPGGFLQASARAEAFMVRAAEEALKGTSRLADLFCGSGAFTLPLARTAAVAAFDAAPDAVGALARAARGAMGLKGVSSEARDLFKRPLSAEELNKFDAALLDPPRSGAAEQVREIARSRLARTVYVSCNPTSFVRDAAVLLEHGFKLRSLAPVDQFLWSPHMELVGVFER